MLRYNCKAHEEKVENLIKVLWLVLYFCTLSTGDVRKEDQEPEIQGPLWLDSKF